MKSLLRSSPQLSENKERLARFERETRLLASLNHPNIAAIHELEESDGVHFLALEYVPGETLAERIKRGPIPVDDALPLFKQIADGLEAAHEKGVIVPARTTGSLELGQPEQLFQLSGMIDYDIHPDGERFAILQRGPTSSSTGRINIVFNWFEELKRLVPTN